METKKNSNAPKRMKVRRKRNKINTVMSIFLVISILLIMIMGSLYVFVQSKLNVIQRVDETAEVSYTGEISEIGAVELEEEENPTAAEGWDEAGIDTSVAGVVNILLVGQDKRSGEDRQRSDTMIIFSINKNSNQLTMVSLLRDLYVHIPNYKNVEYGYRKLNSAYQYGGFKLLDKTIAENFNITIDYNVSVDFTAFKEIVDNVGGIDIEISKDEARYLRGVSDGNKDGIRTGGRTYDVHKGLVHMDGQMALDYARARHVDGTADLGRTQRQRKILKKLFEIAKQSNWLQLLGMYDCVAKNVTTDMSNNQILSIAFSAYSMNVDEVNSYRIPANFMYHDEITDLGMGVLVPDSWYETRMLLYDYLYSDDGGKSAQEKIIEKYGFQPDE